MTADERAIWVRWRAAAVLALLLVAAPAIAEPPAGQSASTQALRVLFVGNSLTYANELPQMVEAVAAAAGGPIIHAVQRARPDHALSDHRRGGALEAQIRNGSFDFVVLQQGPSSLPASRAALRRDVAEIAAIVAESGATTAVFQVWPERGRLDALPAVIESYRLAAADVDARLLPVGSAWQAALALDPGVPLYGPDGFHPSPVGSYLAALVIYEGLVGRPASTVAVTLSLTRGGTVSIPDTQAATLQQALERSRASRTRTP